MAWTYEPMESIVPNATMRKGYSNGVHRVYLIKPNDGYVMHDNAYDDYVQRPVLDEFGEFMYDEFGMVVTEEVRILGYRPTEASVGYNYDWSTTEMLDEAGNAVTAYGHYEFFCKLINEVPADQIPDVTHP